MEEEYVRYVISAHGSDDKTSTDIISGGKILFYVREGEIYDSTNKYQSFVCLGRSIPLETIQEGNQYPSSMYFIRDRSAKWLSGLKDCNSNHIVYNLEINQNGISFKNLIDDILKPYHRENYPGKKFELHVLTCRVCVGSTDKPKKIKVFAHKGKDRSRYIKKTQPTTSTPEQDSQQRLFYNKYLKYKAKYLALKKLIGDRLSTD